MVKTPVFAAVPVASIHAAGCQARRHFDPQRLGELAASIRADGLLQPVVLRPASTGGFELLAGERRWRAAQMAGLHEIPAIVHSDVHERTAQVLGLIENLQRESLTPMETAEGLQRLARELGLSHDAIGRRIGKSRPYVTNFLRLLELDRAVQAWVDDGRLTLGHAKVLCGVSPGMQRTLGAEAMKQGLSVRQLEARTVQLRSSSRRNAVAAGRSDPPLVHLERELADYLGYAVRVEADARGSGRLTVRFDSLDELEGVLARIGYRATP
ncbi:MAG TPA: ParB/RepB/Spo0J family partition protein [Nevskiaceae bacterium]